LQFQKLKRIQDALPNGSSLGLEKTNQLDGLIIKPMLKRLLNILKNTYKKIQLVELDFIFI